MSKKAIIIGSGISGLAMSVRLSVKGYRVTVFEKDELPGGKLNLISMPGYRFDLGPSLFTMPWLVEDLFRIAGKDPASAFSYVKEELACKYFWEDGTILHAWSEGEKLAAEVEKVLKVPRETTLTYLRHVNKLYRYTAPVFMERSLHKLSSYASTELLKAGKYLPNLDIFRSMNRANQSRLKHPKLVQLFNRMATYNGSSPFKAPGILAIIASLEHGSGVYFPEGGMYNITSALVNLAKDLGVEFRMKEEVKEISLVNKKAAGVITSQGEYPADIVVSNADVVHTYNHLLKGIKKPKRILNQERSSSALVFYWGIAGSFPELELHNIFFSENYPAEFDHLFNKLDLYEDPTIYINISSKKNPSDAPKGHENWFVMINAPHENGQDWPGLIFRSRENILSKLNRILKKDISTLIAGEEILDPPGIESKTSSYLGSLYGTSSNSRFAAFLRHPNFSSSIRDLYFIGGSVHPGGGIPLCLLSAKITSELIP